MEKALSMSYKVSCFAIPSCFSLEELPSIPLLLFLEGEMLNCLLEGSVLAMWVRWLTRSWRLSGLSLRKLLKGYCFLPTSSLLTS
jgi:hypothetical protein